MLDSFLRSAPLTGASPQSSFFSWPSVVLRKAGKARLRTALHPRRKARSPASQLFIPSDTEIFLCLRPSKNPRSTAIVCEQRSAARSPTGRGLRTAVALSGLSSSSVLRTLKLVRGKKCCSVRLRGSVPQPQSSSLALPCQILVSVDGCQSLTAFGSCIHWMPAPSLRPKTPAGTAGKAQGGLPLGNPVCLWQTELFK